ncbi:hypothetical protein C2E23DRAFT_306080 [Lenzites betulinus]|nr:hypothetical protein C2E23DRAFT_306080 [Lenzites betulinus]
MGRRRQHSAARALPASSLLFAHTRPLSSPSTDPVRAYCPAPHPRLYVHILSPSSSSSCSCICYPCPPHLVAVPSHIIMRGRPLALPFRTPTHPFPSLSPSFSFSRTQAIHVSLQFTLTLFIRTSAPAPAPPLLSRPPLSRSTYVLRSPPVYTYYPYRRPNPDQFAWTSSTSRSQLEPQSRVPSARGARGHTPVTSVSLSVGLRSTLTLGPGTPDCCCCC